MDVWSRLPLTLCQNRDDSFKRVYRFTGYRMLEELTTGTGERQQGRSTRLRPIRIAIRVGARVALQRCPILRADKRNYNMLT
jgi:hypothetical protein